MKFTTEIFIKKAQEIHQDEFGKPIYDYSKFVYVNSKTKGIISCSEHGEFGQNSRAHLKGHGCKQCATSKKKSNLSSFIKKAINLHKDDNGIPLYDYSEFVYNTRKIKGKIKCKNGHIFEQTPSDHLGGKGCNECFKIEIPAI